MFHYMYTSRLVHVVNLPLINLHLSFQPQSDVVNDESIVYVSEPQQLAHASEEVIDMVENPLSSTVSGDMVGVYK